MKGNRDVPYRGKKMAGWILVLLGVIGAALGIYDIYVFLLVNHVLDFLTPVYSSLFIFVVVSMLSVTAIYLGYRLIRST